MTRLASIALITGLLIAGFTGVTAQQTSQADKALAAANHKATVVGDLRGAIDDYTRIVASAGPNRALAAEALLRMAECHQRLGEAAEAQKIYARIVREYSDQTAAVGQARTQLAARPAARPTTRIAVRQLLSGADAYGDSISSDGRYLVGPDNGGTNVIVRDLVSGTTFRPMSGLPSGERVQMAVVSPDGRWILVAVQVGEIYELRKVLNVPGAPSETMLREPVKDTYCVPKNWYLDNSAFICERKQIDGTWQFVKVPATGGNPQLLESLDWRRPANDGFKRTTLSPDGRYFAYSALAKNPRGPVPEAGDATDEQIYVLGTDGRFRLQLTRSAGRNFNPLWTADGRHLVFQSDRAGTVDLWALPMQDGRPNGEMVVVKKDIGRVTPLGAIMTDGRYFFRKSATNPQVRVETLDGAPPTGDAGRLSREPMFGLGPVWSPDGKRLLFRNGDTLVIRAPETGADERVSIPRGLSLPGGRAYAWTHDSSAVVIALGGTPGLDSYAASTMRTIYRWDVKATRLERVPAIHAFYQQGGPGVALSPDDTTLYLLGSMASEAPGGARDRAFFDRIMAVDLTSGARKEVLRVPEPFEIVFSLSHDGTTFAFTAVPFNSSTVQDAVLMTAPIDGGRPHELLKGPLRGLPVWTRDGKSLLVQHGTGVFEVTLSGASTKRTGTYPMGFALHPDGNTLAYTTVVNAVELQVLEGLEPILNGR